MNELNADVLTPESLRVAIDSGGCHGYQYQFQLTSSVNSDDMFVIFQCEFI
jgi:Fe-S cluster assembly iron-binding protein IscA